MATKQSFSEFLGFCGTHLGDSKDMTRLVKKRYKECDPHFRAGEEFIKLMFSTKQKIQSDSERVFVHLRDFMNQLKAHRLNTEVKSTCKNSNEMKRKSSQIEQRKNKRSCDSEPSVSGEPPRKFPRHEIIIDLSADESDESCDMSNDSNQKLGYHILGNAYEHTSLEKHIPVNREKNSIFEKPGKNAQNISQNRKHFKFKEPVMNSIAAAASSFSSGLSKTIVKAGSGHRTSESKSDILETHVVNLDSSSSSSSRSSSPELPEFDVSCDSLKEKKHKEKSKNLKLISGGISSDTCSGAVETLRSAEISSTTSHMDLEEESSSKMFENSSREKRDISDSLKKNSGKGLPDKRESCRNSAIKLSDLENEINGYVVEMNVSSDDESYLDDDHTSNYNSADYHESGENKYDIDVKTVDFTFSNKNGNSGEVIENENTEAGEKQDGHVTTNTNTCTGTSGCKAIGNNVFSNKLDTQESVILLETDAESSTSENGEINSLPLETGNSMCNNEKWLDALFEDSQKEVLECEKAKADSLENLEKEHSQNEVLECGKSGEHNNTKSDSSKVIEERCSENEALECEKSDKLEKTKPYSSKNLQEELSEIEVFEFEKSGEHEKTKSDSSRTLLEEHTKKAETIENDRSILNHSVQEVNCIDNVSKTSDSQKCESRDGNDDAVLGLVAVSKLKEETRNTKSLAVVPGTSTEISQEAAANRSKEDKEQLENTKKRKKGSKRQIEMLESLLKEIRDKIEELRTRELSLDEMDDETSDYILEDKLQKKFVEVWNKLCQLHKQSASTSRPTQKSFQYQGTRYPDVNRMIERFVNRTKMFPDYRDIRKLIVKVNRDRGLKLRLKAIDELAREAFTDVGNQLQERRQKDFVSTVTTPFKNPVSTYEDPALYDPELKKKLEANRKMAKSQMDKVVETFTHMQYTVGDKEVSDDETSENGETAESTDNVSEKEEVDAAPNDGLDFSSTSGRAWYLRESSQVEIVNDEEEDIGPYFNDTQIDYTSSLVSSTGIGVTLEDKSTKSEMFTESDEESKTSVRSQTESSLSPEAVKCEMDKVLNIFDDEDDEVNIVSDNSESDEETKINLDLCNFTKENTLDIDEKCDVESCLKPDHVKDEQTLSESEEDSQSILSPFNERRKLDINRSVSKSKDDVCEIAADANNKYESVVNSSHGKSADEAQEKAVTEANTSTDKAKQNCLMEANTSGLNICNQKDTAKDIFKTSDLPVNFKQSCDKLESEDYVSDNVDNDLDEIMQQARYDHQNLDIESDVNLKGLENVTNGGGAITHLEKFETTADQIKSLENSQTEEFLENTQGTVDQLDQEVICLGKNSTNLTKLNTFEPITCTSTDYIENRSENKTELEEIQNKTDLESKHVDKLPTIYSQTDKDQLAESDDSDIEIVDEYNVNKPYSEKDSQDTYSSKNLDYEEYYTEDSIDLVEGSDFPQSSISALSDEDRLQPKEYENEITSTLVDIVDIKVPSLVSKENANSSHVKLRKPIEGKNQFCAVSSFKKEENLDLIEMYAEPDSTPYIDDMVVSSSGQNEVIVLSDSE